MNIYIATAISRQNEARELRDILQQVGHNVTSRWLDEKNATQIGEGSDDDRAAIALRNIMDLINSDLVIHITGARDPKAYSGGHHFETGWAWAMGKTILIAGERESVFHYLAGIHQCEVRDILAKLDELTK